MACDVTVSRPRIRRTAPWLAFAVLAAGLAAGCATTRAFQRGEHAARAGDWDVAVSYFTRAVQRAPDRPDYRIALERASLAASREHLGRARAYEQDEQLEFALREYRKTVEFDASNLEAKARAQVLEQTIRDRLEASRPRPAIEAMREQARRQMAEPTLNPASREPLFIKFQNQQLSDILNFIGNAAGINVTYDKDFRSVPYSLELSGVSLEQALQQIMLANQLFFKVLNERSIIVIQDTAQKRTQYEEQAIRTFYLSNADPTELTAIITQILSRQSTGPSTLASANKSNNSITVRATVPILHIVERIVAANDRPRAEIVVDVEILEVNRTRAKQYGLELSDYSIGVGFSPESRPEAVTDAPVFNLNTISAGISAADFYGAVPSAAIKFLESDSNTKVVAKPQLRGSEGEKLTLKLGTEVPVPSTTFTPIATGGTAYNPMTSYQYKVVGVTVEIEPRVTYDGDIIMKLDVEVSNIGADKNIAGQNLPMFGTRKATTRLRLRDGESNLLAGLLQESERRSLKGFPGAIHTPILKRLFSSTDDTIEQTDIVMLLTPRIVRTHELTQQNLSPIYIGAQPSLGVTGPPPLIAVGEEAKTGTTPPGTTTSSMAPGTPVPGPAGSSVSAVIPPGSSPIPGTVGIPATPPVTTTAAAASTTEPVAPPTVAPEAGGGQVVVSVPADDWRVAAGPYTVPLSVAGVSRMTTVSLSLSYNPRLVRVRLVQEGSFMRQGGVAVTFAQHVDAVAGRVDITMTRSADSGGASGTGMLAAVQFDALAPGAVAFQLGGVATGAAGTPIPLQFVPASATVR